MNDDEFFSATDQLKIIHQWARARYAAPWAVLVAVLLRVSATTEPKVQLPGVIGGRASLNLFGAFASPSGGGKGISDQTARLAWPADIHEEGLGSGEGLAELFKAPKNPEDERISRALFMVPEVDQLAALAKRQGNTVMAVLKAAAMGERLGSKGASSATSRLVAPHTYRLCLSIGTQPGHSDVIFDDATGGTPQRILWALGIDPDMPAESTPDPEPLDTALPFSPDEHGVIEIVYGPPEIREQIVAAHIARQRGEADALDGHAMLTRCKVAAVLAILHQRRVVSELDWALSGVVMDHSNRTRDWMLAEAKRAARAKVRDRALARAAGDEVYDQRLLDRVKRSIEGMLTRDGEQASSDLRRRLGKREKRDLFDQAVAELEHDGTIELVPGRDRGSRFRIGHGDQAGHPIKPQVSEGDQFGHRDHFQQARATKSDSRPPESDTEEHVDQNPTRCANCNVDLPRAAAGALCDACDDGSGGVMNYTNPPPEERRGDDWKPGAWEVGAANRALINGLMGPRGGVA